MLAKGYASRYKVAVDTCKSLVCRPIQGDIDYKGVFENAALAGLKHFVIEQDTAGQDDRMALEDCRIAYLNRGEILSTTSSALAWLHA